MDIETGGVTRQERRNSRRCGTLLIILIGCVALLLAFVALILSGSNIAIWRQSNVTGFIQAQGTLTVETNELIVGDGLILENDIADYVPSPLDYSEQTSITVTFTGAFTANQTLVFYFTRIGNIVVVAWGQLFEPCSVASNILTSPGTIPTRFLPIVNVYEASFVMDAGTIQATPGSITLSTTGQIVVDKTAASASFTGSSTCGFGYGSVTYITPT